VWFKHKFFKIAYKRDRTHNVAKPEIKSTKPLMKWRPRVESSYVCYLGISYWDHLFHLSFSQILGRAAKWRGEDSTGGWSWSLKERGTATSSSGARSRRAKGWNGAAAVTVSGVGGRLIQALPSEENEGWNTCVGMLLLEVKPLLYFDYVCLF
jgi:hypothetical protein